MLGVVHSNSSGPRAWRELWEGGGESTQGTGASIWLPEDALLHPTC